MTWTQAGLAAVVVLPLLVIAWMVWWPNPYQNSSHDEKMVQKGVGPVDDPMPTRPLPRRPQ